MLQEMTSAGGILLDTHVWVRLQMLSHPLSTEAIEAIRKAGAIRSVYVPAISVWEIAKLTRRNRLQLNMSVSRWVTEALDKPGIQLLPFTIDIAIEAAELPEPMYKDPADRMIVASARVERLTLITSDKPMLRVARHMGIACVQA
jgi:PIN domain nuclease of toxin-antitoxin system